MGAQGITKYGEVILLGSARSATTGASTLVDCEASGNYKSAGIFSVQKARSMQLFLGYTAAAAGANGQGGVIVLLSAVPMNVFPGAAQGATAAAIADIWFARIKLAVADTAVTLGPLPTSQAFTKTPGWVSNATKRDLVVTDIASAGTDISRLTPDPISVEGAQQVQILYAEIGDTTHPGKMFISYSLADF
jgi:hypothetical protein